MVRCFVAVNIPEDIRRGVVEVQRQVLMLGMKAVEPHCLHVTMYFLGEVSDATVERIRVGLRGVKDAPLPIAVEEVGAFPSQHSPRVVWVGAHGELVALHSDVEGALGREGFPTDPRFHPHITIGRVKHLDAPERAELAQRIAGLSDVKVGEFVAVSFELMESTLTPKGPIYEVLESFPL